VLSCRPQMTDRKTDRLCEPLFPQLSSTPLALETFVVSHRFSAC
jgi:hypothetical protein